MWQCPVKIGLVHGPVKGYSLRDQIKRPVESEHLLCGVCECPVNLMLGPVICTLLLNRMFIQLQLTNRETLVYLLFLGTNSY